MLGFVLKNIKKKIYAYGFGDIMTKNKNVFSFSLCDQAFRSFQDVLLRLVLIFENERSLIFISFIIKVQRNNKKGSF